MVVIVHPFNCLAHGSNTRKGSVNPFTSNAGHDSSLCALKAPSECTQSRAISKNGDYSVNSSKMSSLCPAYLLKSKDIFKADATIWFILADAVIMSLFAMFSMVSIISVRIRTNLKFLHLEKRACFFNLLLSSDVFMPKSIQKHLYKVNTFTKWKKTCKLYLEEVKK